MGLMRRGSFPVALLVGVFGIWAGNAVSAVPPPPTVSLPTVTVPVPPLPPPPETPPVTTPVPLPPPPPPPAMTVPPSVEPPPLPASPPPPADAPAATPSTAESVPLPPALRGVGSSSVRYTRKVASDRPRASKRAPRSRPEKRAAAAVARPSRETASPIARAGGPRVRGVTASVRGPVPEDGGFLAPIGAAFSDPQQVIPGALLAMAAMAVFLLGIASMPPPIRSSRTGAMLVHKRGSIALAGGASLAMAAGTYLLL